MALNGTAIFLKAGAECSSTCGLSFAPNVEYNESIKTYLLHRWLIYTPYSLVTQQIGFFIGMTDNLKE